MTLRLFKVTPKDKDNAGAWFVAAETMQDALDTFREKTGHWPEVEQPKTVVFDEILVMSRSKSAEINCI